MDLAAGLVLAGRYKLLEPIGEGGRGSVWLAQQSEPIKRKVAIRLITLGMDSSGGISDLGPNEFMENRAACRNAWMDWQGLNSDPAQQP